MIRTAFAACSILVLFAGLAGCSHQQPQPTQTSGPVSHDQLRIAFRASFMSSCEKGVPGPQGLKYCTCADDGLESTFTDAQLSKLSADDPKLRAITHACAKKSGLRIRPGR